MIISVAFAVALIAAATAASGLRDDSILVTIVVGAAVTVAGIVLVFASLLRGRTAIVADTLSLPAMRFSGRLALAAQVLGITGVVATLILGYLQGRRDADLGPVIGVVMAVCCTMPILFGGTLRRLARRLTA